MDRRVRQPDVCQQAESAPPDWGAAGSCDDWYPPQQIAAGGIPVLRERVRLWVAGTLQLQSPSVTDDHLVGPPSR